MTHRRSNDQTAETAGQDVYRVRLPGFVNDQEIGLGDIIKRATSYLGIRPCSGCNARAAAHNRRVVFTGPRSK